MWIYFLFFVPVFWAYNKSGKLSDNAQLNFLKLYLAGLALYVGLADMMGGYDRYIYSAHFDFMADLIYAQDYKSAYNSLFTQGKSTEWGFTLTYFIISFITRNRYIYILIMTLIMYTLLFKSFKRYMRDYPMGIMLFLGLWFFFTFTYLRQVMACSIVWLSIKYVVSRDFKRYLLLFIIAYLMHNSAVVFFPLYFVPMKKYSKMSVIIVMVFLLFVGLTNVAGNMFAVFGGLIGAEERTEHYSQESTAFRYEYIIEAALFLYVILQNYHLFRKENKQELVLMNMSLIFCGILLLFCMNTQGGRLSWFYMIGLIATLTRITKSKKRFSQDNMTIVLLSLLLFTRIVFAWDYLLSPYKTFLTDGVRDYDPTWEEYEYDHVYDNNKMYRDPWLLW